MSLLSGRSCIARLFNVSKRERERERERENPSRDTKSTCATSLSRWENYNRPQNMDSTINLRIRSPIPDHGILAESEVEG